MLSSFLILRLAVKTVKDHYYTGTESLAVIGNNDTVVDYYAQLNKKDIELTGMVDINSAEIKELTTLPSIRVKTAEKIINKRNELGRDHAGSEHWEKPAKKIFSHISDKLGI